MEGCELSIPYPPIQVSGKSQYFAALLTNDYAGVVSELSAATTYSFQRFVSKGEGLGETLHCISIVEMRHLAILGRLVALLGGNPRFAVQSGTNCIFWNAQNICYENRPRLYLKQNITTEQAAIDSYRLRLRQISDPHIRAIIERIILDEERHIELFSALLNEYH